MDEEEDGFRRREETQYTVRQETKRVQKNRSLMRNMYAWPGVPGSLFRVAPAVPEIDPAATHYLAAPCGLRPGQRRRAGRRKSRDELLGPG